MRHQLPQIGLNAQLLSLASNYRSAGINRYIQNLLMQFDQQDQDYRFTAFLSSKEFPVTGHLKCQVSRWSTGKPPARILWEQLVQPLTLWRQKFDLLHSMAFVVPFWSPCPSIVTIFDLSFLRYPENFRPWNRFYLTQSVRLSAKRAEHFIAISRSTASDIVNLLGVDASRISVTYCGVEDHYHPLPSGDVEQFRRDEALPRRMILYLGTIEPRKNLGTLIQAYQRLTGMWSSSAGSEEMPRLVIAGGKGWEWEAIFALVEKLDLGKYVLFPGFVPDKELPLWYNAAECFAYPSQYEGFGLPALEAMACGVPVVTSNTSSLPEVVGDAGLTFSPEDVDGLAHALMQVLTDDDLKDRMQQQALKQASRFSWKETARQTLAVYEQVLNRGGQ